jgi:hypothetical protein
MASFTISFPRLLSSVELDCSLDLTSVAFAILILEADLISALNHPCYLPAAV